MLPVQTFLFYGLLVFLLLAAVMSGVSLARHNLRAGKSVADEIGGLKSRIRGLDGIIREKEDRLQKQLQVVDKQAAENEILKANKDDLGLQLADLKERLGKETALKTDLAAKVVELEEELAKARKESALSNQMHEGLKGQYDELEEKFSQLFQQFLEEQKKNQPLVNLQTPPS
jgi:chromosome segregation ATPase